MLLFTYGLNMTPPRFCPSCRFIGRAFAIDNALAFSGSNVYWGHQGYATLRYEPNDKTYGILYQIDPKDLPAMDLSQTLGLVSQDNIIPTPVQVVLIDDGSSLKAQTYVQNRIKMREPTPEYYARLKQLYDKYLFPQDALSKALLKTRGF
jgi:hypothetical protein